MLRNLLLTALCVALLASAASAQVPSSPKLTPAPSTEEQKRLIDEGVQLHDRQDYDAAIRKYEEVLKANPDNVSAMYEMAYSLSEKKDYKKSLEVAQRGAQYKADLLVGFYLLIGNDLDLLEEPKKAQDVYKAGMKLFPTNSLLYYNMAVSLHNAGKPEEARENLKKALAYNPEHTTSHIVLAQIYFNANYKTPALLAALRFLVLEPNSNRSGAAIKIMRSVLQGGASQGKTEKDINIFVDMSAKKDEGDFGGVDLMLGMTKALGMSEKNKGKSEMQLFVEQVDTVLAILAEQDPKLFRTKFVGQYYVPYFAELQKRKLVEPFCYYILQAEGRSDVQAWLKEHSAQVAEFLAWSKNYRWAKPV